MLPYEAIIAAFGLADPDIQRCPRAGELGFVHIHGPLQQRGPRICTTHWVSVEKYNGTVTTREEVGQRLKFDRRPLDPATGVGVKIQKHPLGSSHKLNYGKHTHALSFEEIRLRWPDLKDFAREMIATCRTFTEW